MWRIRKPKITSLNYLNFRGYVEVVVVFSAGVHHAVQHAEDHVAEESQILWCGRFNPKLPCVHSNEWKKAP